MTGIELGALGVAAVKALLPLLVTLGGYVVAQANTYLRAKVTSTYATTALDVLEHLTRTVVKELELTVAPAFRAKLESGKLTREDAQAIKDQAVETVLSFVGQKGLQSIMQGLGLDQAALKTLVSSKVEQAVYDMKHPGQTALPQFTQAPKRSGAPIAGSPEALNYKS